MMAPLYKFGMFGDEVSLVVAFVIGLGFGFFLERAGFGDSRVLAGQWYGYNFAVLRVMFSAIVVANSTGSWKTIEICRRSESRVSSRMSRPSIFTLPCVGS